MAYRPIPNDHSTAPTYTGAYGRDGAPASRVVRPLNASYQPRGAHQPSPRNNNNLHVDTASAGMYDVPSSVPARSPRSARGQAPPRVGGGMPYQHSSGAARIHPSTPSPPPPSYHSSDGGHSPSAQYPSPPKAAFFSPAPSTEKPSPFSEVKGTRGGGGGGLGAKVRKSLMWGSTPATGRDVREKAAQDFRGDDEPPAFWKRMSSAAHMRKQEQKGEWLSKQTGASGKVKFVVWAVVLLVLAGVGGTIAWRVTHKHDTVPSNNTSPEALSWANGATDVPSIFATPTGASSTKPPAPMVTGGMRKRHEDRTFLKRHFGSAPAAAPLP